MDVLRVAAVTDNAPLGDPAAGLSRVRRWAQEAQERQAHLALFPELYLSGYAPGRPERVGATPLPGPLSQALQAIADELQMALLVGAAERSVHDRIYASHLVVCPGQPLRWYRKLHIAPPEETLFAPGEEIVLFEYRTWRFGVQLCYDAHFPELATCMALRGADAIFVPHASPRGTPMEKLRSWRRHLPARAYDNGVYVVACNQAGDNGAGLRFPAMALAIGPDGEELGAHLTGQAGMLVVELSRSELRRIRSHRMRYFLPRRRAEIYQGLVGSSASQ